MSDEAIIRQLTRSALSHLVGKVMELRELSLSDALKVVYDSRLYTLIVNSKTGLYREGPLYLYSMLCEESAHCT